MFNLVQKKANSGAEMKNTFTKDYPVESLIPYINNARTHSAAQIDQVAASIKEFGFTNPILIDDQGGVVAGHGRLLAAAKLKMSHVPTITLVGLTEAQKKAYILADNQLALNSGWDLELLKVELENLVELDFDLDLIGFDDDFINGLLTPEPVEGLVDEDRCPEPEEDPVSVKGDIWILGNHRLMCGDSTDVTAVEVLLNNQKSDLIFTDPPYGMAYGGGRARGNHSLRPNNSVLVKAHGMILGDDLEGEDLMQMIKDSLGNAIFGSKEGSATYVCFTWRTYTEFHDALEEIACRPKACIVWDKKSIGLGKSNYRPQHEFIFYTPGHWFGDKSESDVWYMTRGATGDYVHPTQKPVELIERAIKNSSKAGDVIHDCFGGSGSTLIAAEKTGRHAYLMELDEKYVDVIVKRWQEFTGKEAIHADGHTFNSLIDAKAA